MHLFGTRKQAQPAQLTSFGSTAQPLSSALHSQSGRPARQHALRGRWLPRNGRTTLSRSSLPVPFGTHCHLNACTWFAEPLRQDFRTSSSASQDSATPSQQDMQAEHIAALQTRTEQLQAQQEALSTQNLAMQQHVANLEKRLARLEEERQWAMQCMLPQHPAWHSICNPFCFLQQGIAALEVLARTQLEALHLFANRPDPFTPAQHLPLQ